MLLIPDLLQLVCSYLFTDDIHALLSTSKQVRLTGSFKAKGWYNLALHQGLSKHSPSVVNLTTCLEAVANVGDLQLLDCLLGNIDYLEEGLIVAARSAIAGKQTEVLAYLIPLLALSQNPTQITSLSIQVGTTGNIPMIELLLTNFKVLEAIVIGVLNNGDSQLISTYLTLYVAAATSIDDYSVIASHSHLTVTGLLLYIPFVPEEYLAYGTAQEAAIKLITEEVALEVITTFISTYHKYLEFTELMGGAIAIGQLPLIKYLHETYQIEPTLADETFGEVELKFLPLEVILYIGPYLLQPRDLLDLTPQQLGIYLDTYHIAADIVIQHLKPELLQMLVKEEQLLVLVARGLTITTVIIEIAIICDYYNLLSALLDLGLDSQLLLTTYRILGYSPPAIILHKLACQSRGP